MGRPRMSQLGWRVKRTTTNSGTKKIRSVVRLFGRFIGYEKNLGVRSTSRRSSLHYSLAKEASQRREFRNLDPGSLSFSLGFGGYSVEILVENEGVTGKENRVPAGLAMHQQPSFGPANR